MDSQFQPFLPGKFKLGKFKLMSDPQISNEQSRTPACATPGERGAMNIQLLEKAKQQWQSAADLMPQLICLMDGEGRLLHINRTMERWGLGNVTSVKGRALHDILHPGCADPDCYFQRFWHDTTPARLEGRGVEHKVFDPVLDRHFSIRVQPLVWRYHSQTRAAEDLHTVVIVDDISDLRQAEAGSQQCSEELAQQAAHDLRLHRQARRVELRNAELAQKAALEKERRVLGEEMQARLLTILEQTTDYVAMADASESMLYLNPAGRAMLGLGPADDISQRKMCDHSDQEALDVIRNIAIPAAIENGLWAGESRMRDSTGHVIYTSQVVIAHRGADGQIDCFSTIVRDISKRVRDEQALRESREELRHLSGLLVSIQEDERRRIALDLHDELGQSLSLIKLAVEKTAEQMAVGATDAALDSLHQVIPLLKEAILEVRRVSTELRPSILDDLGILPTLSWFFREFEAVCSHIAVEKVLQVSEQEVPAPLKIIIYRIIQEATNNIVKHAAADRVRVSLYRANDALHLLIQDNGRGFDPASVDCRRGESRGLGLISMKERVSLSGGSYHLESSPGFGTHIRASWPLE
jgi:PAS domain S-box-containing protein